MFSSPLAYFLSLSFSLSLSFLLSSPFHFLFYLFIFSFLYLLPVSPTLPNITWLNPSSKIMKSKNSTLFLKNITKSDEGIFTCKATDASKGIKSTETKITVIGINHIFAFLRKSISSVYYKFNNYIKKEN